jgi:tetratricopeptide (TPR) repeat protein
MELGKNQTPPPREASQIAQALAAWQQLLTDEPGNTEAARAVAQLVIASSRERLGMPASAHAVVRPPSSAVVTPAEQPTEPPGPAWQRAARDTPAAEHDELKRTPIQTLEAAVRDQSANPEFYLELADLYLERGREYDAERLLARGREATAGDRRILARWEDVVMLRLEKKVIGARQQAEDDDTPESRAALEHARSERDRIETEIFASRAQREPQNTAARLQLGLRQKRAGKLREAIASLRAALGDPLQKCQAALAMGECHEELHDVPSAMKHYRLAAESANLPNHFTCRQQALYDAGRLAAGMNLPRLARRYLDALLQAEPDHEEALQLAARLKTREEG